MTRALFLILGIVVVAQGCSGGEPRDRPSGHDGGTYVPDGGRQVPCTGADFARCDGECVNIAADARHCGACGNACPAGGVCSSGACECPAGTLDCGMVCADPQINADHCGACGNACPPGTACNGGVCVEQCQSGLWKCGDDCADFSSDNRHCGRCNSACEGGRTCVGGKCVCPEGTTPCSGTCVDLSSDPMNCGTCGTQCFNGFSCVDGTCQCPAGMTACSTACVDLRNDPNNCGSCDNYCQIGQQCNNGFCETPCPPGYTKCGGFCVDLQTDALHCGACGNACGTLSCQSGACVACNSATTDCDNDGWMVSDGDCCDTPGTCGAVPAMVNPGALELVGNAIDDNCNGLVDAADTLDTQSCDTGLASDTADPLDFAKALGICRTTSETAPPAQRTWGLISAHLLQADGNPLPTPVGHSIRNYFGTHLKPLEGRSMVVISSGVASDSSQQNPGPNNGPFGQDVSHATFGVDIQSCSQPYCISDWFNAANPPLKLASRLPEAPGCAGGTLGVNLANDSVMLVLRMRAPTNVRSFQFNGYFLSAEYPEFVCTQYNDQLVALVDLPNGQPIGAVNPSDKNLMTYYNKGKQWPVGINVAKGTGLFRVCDSQTANPTCWDQDVSPASCAHGSTELAGTGFEASSTGGCLHGGGTGWLVTSGNIRPGDIVELRIAIWDVGDHILDSTAIIDAFTWLESPAIPGTTD